jgi:hypothetical protein
MRAERYGVPRFFITSYKARVLPLEYWRNPLFCYGFHEIEVYTVLTPAKGLAWYLRGVVGEKIYDV